ncbi:LysR family transcriptional regulator, partial [Loktanella sp. DJP18]|uniref:LysR family transcriptional regulator n=1 Tax=Loktanella sp. DJP18 TaxID=3409788 RepID=UPI003BB4DBF7
LTAVAPRLVLTATTAQLRALIAVVEAQNFTIAARRLGLAQPTVHRAIALLESEAGRPLFDRAPHGTVAIRATQALGLAARLALTELDQASADLAELDGRTEGQIVIGALPLSRSALLPRTLAAFRARRPLQGITVIDGIYDELLGYLRRGEIDFMIGAMRDPLPIRDVVQDAWYHDGMSVVAGLGHPLVGQGPVPLSRLADFPWVVARRGTPARDQFDDRIARHLPRLPVIETGSVLLMRGLLQDNLHLGCVSSGQAAPEIAAGQMIALETGIDWPGRPIGMTTRTDWLPTTAQTDMLDICRKTASLLPGGLQREDAPYLL